MDRKQCIDCQWLNRFKPRPDEIERGLVIGCRCPGYEGYTKNDKPMCGGVSFVKRNAVNRMAMIVDEPMPDFSQVSGDGIIGPLHAAGITQGQEMMWNAGYRRVVEVDTDITGIAMRWWSDRLTWVQKGVGDGPEPLLSDYLVPSGKVE